MSSQPKLRSRSISPVLRRRIEEAIENLVTLLDALDGNPDLECGADDEPSLGWTLTMAHGALDDREETFALAS